MIPVSPLMIGDLVQPKPSETLALMFQRFAETGVSCVKHRWPAGSHWQRLASSSPGDIKCVRTVSSAAMRFYKHHVKQPHLCKPTNHLPPQCVFMVQCHLLTGNAHCLRRSDLAKFAKNGLHCCSRQYSTV